MPLDERDPHVALGIEHGREMAEPYAFQDAENMRRYLIGYECGLARRRLVEIGQTLQQPTNFQRFAQSLQQLQPRRITASDVQRYWQHKS